MKMSFEALKKECNACAKEFIEELELLPVFLNYFPDVQEKWLKELGLDEEKIEKIKKVIDEYSKRKVELENKELPKERKEVIEIEDKLLKEMYLGYVLKVGKIRKKFILEFLKSKYPNSVILGPDKLEKLENITLFKDHKKRFPVNFLVFEPNLNKIIGYEVIER